MKRHWLIEKRKEKELSQEKLAIVAGISKAYVSEMENGNRTPSGPTGLRIAKILEFPLEKFYEKEIAKVN